VPARVAERRIAQLCSSVPSRHDAPTRSQRSPWASCGSSPTSVSGGCGNCRRHARRLAARPGGSGRRKPGMGDHSDTAGAGRIDPRAVVALRRTGLRIPSVPAERQVGGGRHRVEPQPDGSRQHASRRRDRRQARGDGEPGKPLRLQGQGIRHLAHTAGNVLLARDRLPHRRSAEPHRRQPRLAGVHGQRAAGKQPTRDRR